MCARREARGLGGLQPRHLACVWRGQGSWLCPGRPLSFSSEPGAEGTWRSAEPPHGEGCPFGQVGLLGRAGGRLPVTRATRGATGGRLFLSHSPAPAPRQQAPACCLLDWGWWWPQPSSCMFPGQGQDTWPDVYVGGLCVESGPPTPSQTLPRQDPGGKETGRVGRRRQGGEQSPEGLRPGRHPCFAGRVFSSLRL